MDKKYLRLFVTMAIGNLGLIVLVVTLVWGTNIVQAVDQSARMHESTQAVPSLMYYQGWLATSEGAPLSGTREITFRICDAASGGSCVWEETHQNAVFREGKFAAILGSQGTPITSAVFSQPTRWVEIEIEGESLAPRLQLATVPYAYNTERLNGKTETELLSGISSLPTGAIVWFEEGQAPNHFTRMTNTLGVNIGLWEPLSDMPRGIAGVTCDVWTGSMLLCWNNDRYAETAMGASYDVASDSWALITTTNAPSLREGRSALWTGSEVIIWGGRYSSEMLNTGARYDPTSNRWTDTITVSAPTARFGQGAVWIGNEMIIWGGMDSNYDRLNTGGRYDPISNQWTSMSTTNSPSPRTDPALIWTGSQVIVWGGSDGQNYLKDGALYDPTTDQWTAMNTMGAPPTDAVILWPVKPVWTGSEMIVPCEFYLYFYNPSTNTWRKRLQMGHGLERGYELVVSGDLLVGSAGVYSLLEDRSIARHSEWPDARADLYWPKLFWTGDKILAVTSDDTAIASHTIKLMYLYIKD